MNDLKIGYGLCGSFCTLSKVMPVMETLTRSGAELFPIMSDAVYSTDTRFGNAEDIRNRVEQLCGRPVIHTIAEAEPIGPKKLLDVLVIAPCTGNTLAKLANAVTDTPVTMAAKAHLRNHRPLILAIATNDGLAASAQNIGRLMSRQDVYFVPFQQDDYKGKPNSLIAHFDLIPQVIEAAMEGRQYQPMLSPEYKN